MRGVQDALVGDLGSGGEGAQTRFDVAERDVDAVALVALVVALPKPAGTLNRSYVSTMWRQWSRSAGSSRERSSPATKSA